MFVVFEGIDGAGKTTLSGRVSEELQNQGITVHQARPKGELRSKLAGEIRTLARDPRNLTMSPHTELFLYVARDTQTIDTVIRPSLDKAEVVIADRYLYSALVLSRARGVVDRDDIERVVASAARNLWPDLVVYCDVDLDTSYMRKRIDKILNPRDPADFGRKGLRGLGLRAAMRREYLSLAEEDPEKWIVVDNTHATVEENTAAIVSRMLAKLGRPVTQPKEATVDKKTPSLADVLKRDRVSDVVESFYVLLDQLEENGSHTEAAYHLRSLDSDAAWTRRERLVGHTPKLVLFGLGPLSSQRSIEMRWRYIEQEPERVARTLSSWWADEDEDAWKMRDQLAEKAPVAVANTLGSLDTEKAWQMRDRLKNLAPAVVLSTLKNLDSDRAWSLREELSKKKLAWGLLEGLAHLESERAWEIRRSHLRKALPWVILSTLGCDSEEAWKLRELHLHHATKLVLRSMAGFTTERAWELRREVGEWAKEAITTIKNVDTPEAWELRRDLMNTWPVFTAKSVGMTLASTDHGYDFLWEMAERWPESLGIAHFLVKAIESRENGPQ